jgi:hypothetical protein
MTSYPEIDRRQADLSALIAVSRHQITSVWPTIPELSLPGDRMQMHPSIRWPSADAKIGAAGYAKGIEASLRVQCYTLSNEFRNFNTVCDTRVGASVCECGTSLRDSLVYVRTDGAFNKSIEGFWPRRLRSGGSCLHSHRR